MKCPGSAHLPVVRGRLEWRRVVVDPCGVCGGTHYHGRAGFVDGESSRVAHCSGFDGEYLVVLVDGEGGRHA